MQLQHFFFGNETKTNRESPCIDVSGVPGTGKSATINKVVRAISACDDLKNTFTVLHINGMLLKDPQQAYVELWRKIGNAGKVTPAKATKLLDDYFNDLQRQAHSQPL